MTALVIISWICFLGVAIFLVAVWWFDRRERKLREHRRIEISELAMIFQTLRDVVSEQKMLAKEFNENVEEKIGVIKKIVSEAKNKLAEVEEAIAKCNKRVQEIDDEIDLMISRVSNLKKLLSESESGMYKTVTETESILVEIKERLGKDKDENKKLEERHEGIKDESSEEGDKADPIQLDTDNLTNEVISDGVGEANNVSQISEEVTSLKSAYNQILGIGNVSGEESEVVKSSVNEVNKGNMIDLTPVQKIVLEYHMSGMTTSEIAKELGITKGEVRLILGLALAKIDKDSKE